MTHLLVRVEVADYDAWLRTHLKHAQDRRAYGMTDGPIYRDITNPNAVLVHTIAEDLDRAGQWFTTAAFDRATRESTTMHRDFYLAERQEPRDQADSSGATLIGFPDES
jgi:hypothetical protein